MKRKGEYTPPPFVKNEIPKAELTVRVSHHIRETFPASEFEKNDYDNMPLEDKVSLLKIYEHRVHALQNDLARAIAIRDELNLRVNTELAKPHWVRHAFISSLHGGGANLLHCSNCGRMTAWSFGGIPRCSIFRDGTVPTDASHAMCMVETGTKKFATREERDIANMLLQYATGERKSSKRK
jgi:hypothetical protein